MISEAVLYEGYCTTDGCGCCSNTLEYESKREEVIREVTENIKVALQVSVHLNMDFVELVSKAEEELKSDPN